jgi:hypothetical protein
MAGALTIDTLNASTGVLSTQNGMTGICKAWVNYNGVTQTIRGSFNVSSITYNTTGSYTVNFNNAMPNANYSILCTVNRDYDGSGGYGMTGLPVTRTTTNSKIYTLFGTGGGAYDQEYVGVAVFSS